MFSIVSAKMVWHMYHLGSDEIEPEWSRPDERVPHEDAIAPLRKPSAGKLSELAGDIHAIWLD